MKTVKAIILWTVVLRTIVMKNCRTVAQKGNNTYMHILTCSLFIFSNHFVSCMYVSNGLEVK